MGESDVDRLLGIAREWVLAHTDADIVRIIEAHDRALGQIARALRGE